MADPDKALKEIQEAIKKLSKTRVLIGIPLQGNTRSKVKGKRTVKNAALGYIHEFGSPAQNIPRRPFLVPGVRDSRKDWEPYMRQAAEAAMKGDDGLMMRTLEAAGMKAVVAVKKRIVDKIPPPLSPYTVAMRARSTPADVMAYRAWLQQYKMRRKTLASSPVTPLVDTAQMMNSITYVVKTK